MSGDHINHQNSTEWQFSNPSMSSVPPNPSIPICQGIQMGSSSCPPVSMVDSFCPNLWTLPTNSLNSGFGENTASSSNNVPIGKPIPLSPRLCMGLNSSDPTMAKVGMFLPTNPGIVPSSLSHYPADSSFIERAARFSSFSGANFSGMANPFGMSESMNPYAGAQAQPSELVGPEVSGDASMQIGNVSKSESPIKSRRDNGGCSEGTPELANVSGDSSSQGIGAKKRKPSQDMELNQIQGGPQFSADTTEENIETNKKVESKSSTLATVKPGGKNAKGSSDAMKEDYIHVRARRGQATNSHSLAERVRRERISERMKYLQDLVPGCSKVTGKAVMLDEIINYVQSLQRQVEFLSMKLAAVNPSMDINIEGLLSKQLLQPMGGPSTMGFATDLIHQQGLVQSGIPGMLNHPDTLRRPTNAQLMPMNGFKEPGTQIPNPWDNELHNLLQMTFGTNPPPNQQDLNGKSRDGFPM